MNATLQDADIARAVELLRAGQLVAFPTETVYGLGANARDAAAVAKIFAAKGRPADHPLIVHIASARALPLWAAHVPEAARRLAEAFWPGPLTLVLPRADGVPDAVTGGLSTVGLRVPRHPVALALLRAFDGGLAAPSANRYGRVSPTSAAHVRDGLGDRVDLVLDGGRCEVGLESTIVDLSGDVPVLLRPGAVTQAMLERVLGERVHPAGEGATPAPGRKPSHYAPRARVLLASDAEAVSLARCFHMGGARVGLLSATAPMEAGIDWLGLPPDTDAQARELYQRLHDADTLGLDIVVAVVPRDHAGIGEALRDRLRRAAGLGDGTPDASDLSA
ncbi:threonylcarbamoyl-AMP synthase [Lysobacter xinjiangensis]|uniref:Threonylcarbamoyl-AMP synthase n=1 Tax=Cognatilysobacter xinjiangensis TaxID=546892 RepID=A0ABQ3C4D3_9GAMM|nr:L-threonylcarbamoyladenylate synthase [Lysobacter xinjiangensis]GGZ66551.1 threonylcarbamoyl-AMP synthase [Lysobacter xinjiangensis]